MLHVNLIMRVIRKNIQWHFYIANARGHCVKRVSPWHELASCLVINGGLRQRESHSLNYVSRSNKKR